MGTIHLWHPPMAPGHLCCGSTTPQPRQAHSLQGEGEVILAGLAVAHQVTGLLAQPQQCLCVCPADGPVVPAEGERDRLCWAQSRHGRKGSALGQQQCQHPQHLPRDCSHIQGEGRVWHHWGWETRGRDKQAEMWGQERKEEASLPQGPSWCDHRAPYCR